MISTNHSPSVFGMKGNEIQASRYRRQGYWGDATLLDCWQLTVLRHPEKTAVVDTHGQSLTYAEVDATSARIARYLCELGIEPGDIVSCQIPGWCEFLPLYIACLKAGAVVNPMPPGLRYSEMRHVLSLCESKIIFTPHSLKHFCHEELALRLRADLPKLQEIVIVDKFNEGTTLPELHRVINTYAPLSREDVQRRLAGHVRGDHVAAVLFTSGSEGTPKGVLLTHNNIIFSESSFAAHLNITEFDTMFMPAPVTHATGFHHGVTMPFLVGGTAVLQDVFVAKITLESLERYHCTVSMATPSFMHDMLRELETTSYDLSSLRFFLCGGSPLNQRMIEDARGYGIAICNIYGATESVPHTGTRPGDSMETQLYTVGRPMPGIEVRVVDSDRQSVPCGQQGQEASRGPQVCAGYLKQPEVTDRAIDDEGWYYSGDLGVIDNEGCLHITDRIKDVIIRGGINISSLEVENILLRHPNIREAAVVGMPDPRLVEKICAYVVLRDPAAGLTFEALCAFMLTQDIMKQKFPERLEIVTSLPRTSSGKVQKSDLRKAILNTLHLEGASFTRLPLQHSRC